MFSLLLSSGFHDPPFPSFMQSLGHFSGFSSAVVDMRGVPVVAAAGVVDDDGVCGAGVPGVMLEG